MSSTSSRHAKYMGEIPGFYFDEASGKYFAQGKAPIPTTTSSSSSSSSQQNKKKQKKKSKNTNGSSHERVRPTKKPALKTFGNGSCCISKNIAHLVGQRSRYSSSQLSSLTRSTVVYGMIARSRPVRVAEFGTSLCCMDINSTGTSLLVSSTPENYVALYEIPSSSSTTSSSSSTLPSLRPSLPPSLSFKGLYQHGATGLCSYNGSLCSIKWSPTDPDMFLSASWGGEGSNPEISLSKVGQSAPIDSISLLRKTIWSVEWTTNGECCFVGANERFSLLNISSKKMQSKKFQSDVICVTPSPHSSWQTGIGGLRNGGLELCDFRDRNESHMLYKFDCALSDVKALFESHHVVASCVDGSMSAIDVRFPSKIYQEFLQHVNSSNVLNKLTIHCNQNLLAALGEDHTLRLWSLKAENSVLPLTEADLGAYISAESTPRVPFSACCFRFRSGFHFEKPDSVSPAFSRGSMACLPSVYALGSSSILSLADFLV